MLHGIASCCGMKGSHLIVGNMSVANGDEKDESASYQADHILLQLGTKILMSDEYLL